MKKVKLLESIIFAVLIGFSMLGCKVDNTHHNDGLLLVSAPSANVWIISGTGTGTRQHTRNFTASELSNLSALMAQVGGNSRLVMRQGGTISTTQLCGLGISAGTVSIDKTGFSAGLIEMTVTVNSMLSGNIIINW